MSDDVISGNVTSDDARRRPFFIFLALLFALWTLRATVLYAIDESIPGEPWRSIYSNVVKLLLLVAPALLYIAIAEKKNPFRYCRMTTPVDRYGLGRAALAALLFACGLLLVEGLRDPRGLAPLIVPASRLLGATLSAAPSAILEEIAFRGLVLHKLDELYGFAKGNLITSILFVLIHWPYWITTSGLNATMLVTSASILIFSLVLGYIAKRSNSLWPAAAAHVANNVFAALMH